MAADMFDGMDDGVGLEKAYVEKRGQSWQDWRRGKPMIRIGRTGEDGTVSDWAALFEATPIALMDTGYIALRGGPIYYNMFLSWLEDQRSRETRAPAPVVPKDHGPALLAFLNLPNPTPQQAAAIAYLRKLAISKGVYSLDLKRAVLGERVVLPEPTNATIAASMAKDSTVITRLQKAGFIK